MKTKTMNQLVEVLVFITAANLLTPTLYFLFSGTLRDFIWLLPLYNFVLLSLGFGMQWLYGLRFGYRFSVCGDAPTVGHHGFRSAGAAIPLLAAILLSVLSYFPYKELYYQLTIRSTDLWQAASPLPFLSAVGTFVPMLIGIILWFYPPDQIIRFRLLGVIFAVVMFLLVLNPIMGANGIVPLMSPGSPFLGICGVCFSIAFVCLLVLFNQCYIVRNYRGSIVSVITPEARLYNLRMVGYMLLAILAVLGLLYVIFSGIATLVRMLLFTVLYAVLRDSGASNVEYRDPELAASEFSKVVYGESASSPILFWIFIGILVLFLLLIVSRKLRDWVNGFFRWLQDVFAFWAMAGWAFGHAFSSDEEIEILNYTDEETKRQKAAIRDYNAMADNTGTYNAFLSQLNGLPDAESKMSYAYAMTLRACRRAGVVLKKSDTPRQALEKLKRFEVPSAAEFTEVFELVKYARQQMPSRTHDAIQSMCNVVKKYMF